MAVNFTAIDFETANERPDSVCSLGLVRVENGKIIDRRYRLIRPPDMRFSERNIMVHGIYPRDVEKEPQFYRYWKALKPLLEEHPVTAHNADFDFGVLQATLNRYRLDYPELDYTCSLRASRRTWKGMPSYGLGSMADYFGYKFIHHHALEDAEMAAKLMIHACEKLGADSIEELNEQLGIAPGRMYQRAHIRVKSLKRQ